MRNHDCRVYHSTSAPMHALLLLLLAAALVAVSLGTPVQDLRNVRMRRNGYLLKPAKEPIFYEEWEAEVYRDSNPNTMAQDQSSKEEEEKNENEDMNIQMKNEPKTNIREDEESEEPSKTISSLKIVLDNGNVLNLSAGTYIHVLYNLIVYKRAAMLSF